MKKLMRAASAVLAATMALSVTAFAEEGGTFKIGGIGPLTGSTAIYGQAVMNAAQMAAGRDQRSRRHQRLSDRVQSPG